MSKLNDYIEAHSEAEDALLTELDRVTNLRVVQPKMVSGRVQGAFLKIITEIVQPRLVLEIGTFTGYSALSIAAGMASDPTRQREWLDPTRRDAELDPTRQDAELDPTRQDVELDPTRREENRDAKTFRSDCEQGFSTSCHNPGTTPNGRKHETHSNDYGHEVSSNGRQEVSPNGEPKISTNGWQDVSRNGRPEISTNGWQDVSRNGRSEISMNGGSEPLPQNAPAWQAPPSNGREQETNSSGREQETNSNDHGQENMLNRFDLKVQKWIDGHTTTPNGEPDAVLHTIEVDDELEDLARSFFDRSPHGYKIRLHIGSALEVVPRLFRELGGRQFDLVFIDGDKREYPAYYKMLMGDATAAMENHKARPMVRHGGIILADNVLWYGKVVNLPEMSEAAGGSGSHEGSGADGTVEASEAHECSDAPNKSKLPNVPKSHDEPGTLERLGTPDAPKSPNTQKSPDAPKSPDRHTAGIVEFNRLVVSDPRVENVILPLRDGINMIRVK